MDNPQPPLEERRVAQQACKRDERRLRVFVYEAPMWDQETETAREAQRAVSAFPASSSAAGPAA